MAQRFHLWAWLLSFKSQLSALLHSYSLLYYAFGVFRFADYIPGYSLYSTRASDWLPTTDDSCLRLTFTSLCFKCACSITHFASSHFGPQHSLICSCILEGDYCCSVLSVSLNTLIQIIKFMTHCSQQWWIFILHQLHIKLHLPHIL